VTVPPTHAGDRRIRGPRTVVTEHTHLAGRTPVASFTRYADAERTLALLAGARFPVDRLALIGGDLKLVDDGGARLTGVRTAVAGAAAGGWLGALLALYTFVLDRPPVGALTVGLCWGVAIGGLFGVTLATAGYATFGRSREPGARRLVAARYELYVDGDVAASAWRLLFTMHPTGLALVDRVPVEVVPPAVEPTLIEPMEPVRAPAPRPEPADAA
jgi:Heat induced stress protein YflT domain